MKTGAMERLLQRLGGSGPVVTDGAWGTQLQALGLGFGDSPERWNITEPDRVATVARGYVEAGSRAILTNTFGGSRVALASHGLTERAREINRLGVEISKQAAGDRALVFASMGPSGKLLMTGDITEEELCAAFEEQAQAFAEAGADGIVVETMTDLEEARIAVVAAARTGLPVVACMTFGSGKGKDRTMMGVTPEQAASGLLEAGASMVGANCGTGAADYEPVCRRLREASGRPVWLKPNAGLPEMVDGTAVYHTPPEVFAEEAARLVAAGAVFIGGCCGSSPDLIRALVGQVARDPQ
jgi:5-methyltetrahydrofolate--homocysteine methyltransferase